MHRPTFFILALLIAVPAIAQRTERQLLSGPGSDSTIDWELRVSGGRRANEWAPVPVPSNWEMQGFGTYHYTYESGREGDMPLAGFSPGKAATVLYGMMGFSDSEALLAKLGKHTTGKGCLYIKKLADVDQKVLEALVVKSVAARRARESN